MFPYKRIPDLALSVPDGWAIGRSDTGWMTAASFFEYIANVFYPWLLEKNTPMPVILFIDGHKSHYNLELYEFCVDKQIILYCVYPNATHILQPCDLGIFRPLKTEWKEVCRSYKQRSSTSITRHNFCGLFKEAFDKSAKVTTILNAFRSCGLCPLNEDAVDYSKCISSRRHEIFAKPCNNDLSQQDYSSCLKVIESFLGETKTAKYNKLYKSQTELDDGELYSLWKVCKDKFIEENGRTEVGNEILQQNENEPEGIIPFTEHFLNDLPLEIDGVVYPLIKGHSECNTHEYDSLPDQLTITENTLPDLSIGDTNYCDIEENEVPITPKYLCETYTKENVCQNMRYKY
ncbi:DDE superfamily endonuclease [Popillia japonica]|uniref:DDE superfamily endonuclease n=1 Tax=Popillia japonica TaxID=7064 RepID=A0AAW1HFR6_POPJA